MTRNRYGKVRRISTLLNLVLIVLIVFLVRQVIGFMADYNHSDKKDVSRLMDSDIDIVNTEIIGIKNKKERPIDGVLVQELALEVYPKMVTVENHSSARPQSGVEYANLVIEAPVEGGITRFLAVFADDFDVNEIGPIRSARPYFLDWAMEFGALYVHVGGSPDALSIVKNNKNIHNLNQYFESKYFWRSSKRPRPHNVYSSSELLNIAIEKKELKNSNFIKWKYKEDGPINNINLVDSISIYFSTDINNVEWLYDVDKNNYKRYQAGKPHTTIDGNNIESKNIVIQKTSIVSVDSEDRKDIRTVGGGEAIVFLDGDAILGSWEKLSKSDRTIFYDNDGEEVFFNRGTTWIEVIDESIDIVF